MRLSGTVMEIRRLKRWTHARTDAQVILYSVQCYALHLTDKKTKQLLSFEVVLKPSAVRV